jgi:hypothetical protein
MHDVCYEHNLGYDLFLLYFNFLNREAMIDLYKQYTKYIKYIIHKIFINKYKSFEDYTISQSIFAADYENFLMQQKSR